MKPAFSSEVQGMTDSGAINIRTAKFLEGLLSDDRAPLLRLFSSLKFGVNKQREITEWINDVLHRENVTVSALCQDLGLETLLSDPGLNAPQKSDLFRERLQARRFPTLAQHLEALQATMRAAKLPSGTRLSVESPLEDAVFKLEITFQSKQELEEKLRQLLSAPPVILPIPPHSL